MKKLNFFMLSFVLTAFVGCASSGNHSDVKRVVAGGDIQDGGVSTEATELIDTPFKERAAGSAQAIVPKIQALLSGDPQGESNIFSIFTNVVCQKAPKSVVVDEHARTFKVILRCGSYRPEVYGSFGDGDDVITQLVVRNAR